MKRGGNRRAPGADDERRSGGPGSPLGPAQRDKGRGPGGRGPLRSASSVAAARAGGSKQPRSRDGRPNHEHPATFRWWGVSRCPGTLNLSLELRHRLAAGEAPHLRVAPGGAFSAGRRSIGRPCVPAGTMRRAWLGVRGRGAGPGGRAIRRVRDHRWSADLDVSLGGAGRCLAGRTERSSEPCTRALLRLHGGASRKAAWVEDLRRGRGPRSNAELRERQPAAEPCSVLPSVSAVRSAARRGRRGDGWADDMLFAGAVVPTILGSGVGARSA